MRGGILAAKALFMIVIIVMVTFTVSDISPVRAENNVCCERTTADDSCVYTAAENCDENYLQATTSCEQTAFCKAGCCISDVGQCSKSVARFTCESLDGYSWQEGSDCAVEACEKNCCVIAETQCAYTTEANCEFLIKDLEDITLDFRTVDSERSCTDICHAADKGCCVSEDSCVYGTQSACANPEIDPTAVTGFYKDEYCSDFGGCGCAEHEEKKCVDEDVYWFDYCGNQEEKAEDCDYTQGNWCGTDDAGEVTCVSTACEPTTFNGAYSVNGVPSERDVHDSKIGGRRENGESWCLYESPAGGWFDRPGSQHYRAICYFGEEIIEPCEDFREKVCIQYPYTDAYEAGVNALNSTGVLLAAAGKGLPGVGVSASTFKTGEPYTSKIRESGSACIDNGVYQNLINANVTTVPRGGDFWSGTQGIIDTCASGSISCPVTFAKIDRFADWKCVYNCQCLTQEWADKAAGFCGSRGDCGAKVNIVGEYTDAGFAVTRSQETVGQLTGTGEVKEEAISAFIAVAYDEGCQEYYEGEPDNKGCVKDCRDAETSNENCYFITTQDSERVAFLQSQYGVYGGMVGFSQVIGTFVEDQYTGLSTAAKVGYAVLGSIIGGFIGTSVLFTVGVISTGAVGGAIAAGAGVIGPLLSAASASATVPGAGWIVALVILIAVAITYWITSGGDSTTVTISSTCLPWQPPAGLANCELCDKPVSEGGLALDDGQGNILNGYECTEYKCHSLGSLCSYIPENQGTTKPKCVGLDIQDSNAPYIESAYLQGDYADLPVEFVKDDHLKVLEEVAPYTFFEFGIETDEPSQCKIQEGGELPEDYFAMTNYFPDAYVDYVHNQTWVLTPDENYTFYIRCWDRVEDDRNVDEKNFVVQVSTSVGADITPPQIEATSIRNGGYVPAGENETLLTVFVDEPAQCKWSSTDIEYSLMETYFACSGIPTSASAYFDNECTTALNVNAATNYYWFACEDRAGNANTQNYPFILQSTEPLSIDLVSPSGIIYNDYAELYVQTSGGAEQGRATCSYNGIEFFETNSSIHRQPLEDLPAGAYDYAIACNDVAGNMNTSVIDFTIEVDIDAPQLVSLYRSGDAIYFSTDDATAMCEYYFEDFDFGEGTDVSSSFALTDIKTYYLKCQDVFGNLGEWVVQV